MSAAAKAAAKVRLVLAVVADRERDPQPYKKFDPQRFAEFLDGFLTIKNGAPT